MVLTPSLLIVDVAGWTPLHWAVQNNDIPIAAYLLNHRASPSRASHKGLTPKDLVSRGREGLAMREVLKGAEEAARSRDRLLLLEEDEDAGAENGKGKGRASPASSETSERRRWADVPDKVEEEARERDLLRRMELAMQSAANLEVDLSVLSLDGRGSGLQHSVCLLFPPALVLLRLTS